MHAPRLADARLRSQPCVAHFSRAALSCIPPCIGRKFHRGFDACRVLCNGASAAITLYTRVVGLRLPASRRFQLNMPGVVDVQR